MPCPQPALSLTDSVSLAEIHGRERVKRRVLWRAAEPPSWTVKVWGKLMDAPEALAQSSTKTHALPMSHYIRRITARFASEQPAGGAPQGNTWEKASHSGDHRDHFQIK